MVKTFDELQEKYSIDENDLIELRLEKQNLGYKLMVNCWISTLFFTYITLLGVYFYV